MVSFCKTLKCLCKPAIGTHQVNKVFLSVGCRLFSSGVQVAPEQVVSVREFIERKKRESRIEREPDKSIPPVAWFLLVMPVSAFALGVWQVKRKIEKAEMIKVLKEKSETPPVDLPKDLNQLKDMEFRKVRVKGRFDHSKELYMGPRPFHDEKGGSTESLLSTSKGGYLVITPFKLSDRDLTIHVNRGWVPNTKKLPHTRKEGQITDEVELVGYVRLTEKRQPLSMKNEPEKGFWIYRDLEEMSKVTNAAPVMIEALSSCSVPGGPIGGQTMVTLKDDHLIYMVTWFGMSLVTSWMWYVRYIKKAKVAQGFIF